jgi:glycosyltransferase involved in cell wall biosynthesis
MAYLPMVSVVVPVYDAESTIEECIHSLLRLNYQKENLELIFINNSSADRTVNILNQYSDKIKILHEKKRGPAAARNKGLINAAGEVVAFTDSDCIVDKDWLQNIVNPLQDERIGIVGGKILAKRPCNLIEEFGEIIHDHYRAINEFKPAYVVTGNWASKLSVIKEIGFFDESFIKPAFEDVDLSYRISQADYKFIYKPEAIVYHRYEKTLFGLFQEGYRHGYFSVKNIKKHKIFLRQFGHRRFDLITYKELLSSLTNFVLRRNKNYSAFSFIFNLGKKFGKLFGSIRFCYLDL